MRRAIVKILGDDYEIVEAGDGEQGWSTLTADETIQVVFSDLSMPHLDGFAFLDRIRSAQEERINTMPVVIITGADDDEQTKERALAAGASDFISKPFDSVQLKTRTQTHLQLDTTTRKLDETEKAYKEHSSVDKLTGLPNKRFFSRQGSKDLAFARRHRGELALVRIDIDRFNGIYTKFGKEPAEHVLKGISEILLSNIRREDTAARVGVAKFALVLPSTNRVGAKLLAERIRGEIEEAAFSFGGISIAITVSMGLAAPAIRPGVALEDLLEAAERHLRKATNAGGNRLMADEQQAAEVPASAQEPATVEPPEASPAALQGAFAAGQDEPIGDHESPETSDEMPDLEGALRMIENAEHEALHPHLDSLLQRLLPLVELCNEKLELGLEDTLARLKSQRQ